MTRRNKIIIVVAVVLAVLAIVLLVLSLGKKEAPTNQNQGLTNQAGRAALPNLNTNVNLPATPQSAKEQSSLLAQAITFAEKYGSFSNQAGFENLNDLKVMMTQNFVSQTEKYIADSLAKVSDTTYHGFTTKAISTQIKSQDTTLAQVMVMTQRSEFLGTNPEPRVFYQNILLNFVNSGGAWKVDDARWQ